MERTKAGLHEGRSAMADDEALPTARCWRSTISCRGSALGEGSDPCVGPYRRRWRVHGSCVTHVLFFPGCVANSAPPREVNARGADQEDNARVAAGCGYCARG